MLNYQELEPHSNHNPVFRGAGTGHDQNLGLGIILRSLGMFSFL